MANMLDPEEQTNPYVPQDATSKDMSQPGLQSAWSSFLSNPKLSSALMQTGVAMLQPRGPGQTAVGQIANSVAEGGEAAGRVEAMNMAERRQQGVETENQSQADLRTAQADAARVNANAYDRQTNALYPGGKLGMQQALLAQRSFNAWVTKPEDALAAMSGTSNDPIVLAMQRAYPSLGIKNKGDIINNPQLLTAARKLYSSIDPNTENDPAAGDPAAAPTPPPAVAPAPAPVRMFNGKRITGRPDGWYYDDGSKVQ